MTPGTSEPYKVIIAGSSNLKNYSLLRDNANFFLTRRLPEVEIIGDGSAGAGQFGRRWAGEKNLKVKTFQPDYTRHGRRARFISNRLMIKHADAALVFWNGVSVETKHLIRVAKDKGLAVKVVMFFDEGAL